MRSSWATLWIEWAAQLPGYDERGSGERSRGTHSSVTRRMAGYLGRSRAIAFGYAN
jgi:hypothetical protein